MFWEMLHYLLIVQSQKKLFNVFELIFLTFKKTTKYIIGLVGGGGQNGLTILQMGDICNIVNNKKLIK